MVLIKCYEDKKDETKKAFSKYACQFCGGLRKGVPTLLDDEAIIDEKTGAVE